jgi:Lon protease-like protein
MADREYPTRFPIFPLPSAVLFPGTKLPLRIFEPRYRAMTHDALDGERVLGMVLLKSGDSASESGPAHVFAIGCAGRIVDCQRQADGRFNLILHGERRFRVVAQELTPRGYIVARVELLDDPGIGELAQEGHDELQCARAELEERVVELAQLTAPRGVGRLRRQMGGLDPVELGHALSFGLDCGIVEKQGLLEASSPLERAQLLTRLVEFKIAGARLPDTSSAIN